MKDEELRRIIKQGETSKIQFKKRLDNSDSIADEMIVPNTSIVVIRRR